MTSALHAVTVVLQQETDIPTIPLVQELAAALASITLLIFGIVAIWGVVVGVRALKGIRVEFRRIADGFERSVWVRE